MTSNISKKQNTILWTLRILAAVVLIQTLRFKFTAAPESVYIFSTLGMEPWGRIGTGVVELITAILILWPRFSVYGAILGAGVMSGAIASHLFVLGINLQDDGGLLFYTAAVVFLVCLAIIYLQRQVL
ncbi:DoxX family protein [uncultured Aquimarina sp.]|uniref:DoxX family protein n=1 Tax=uncultured Aquimarina sp. TaxID=575652 RepID=UPI002610F3F2|nr:DoxX family protein [uncultured Aquimarina sp.]